MAYVYLDGFENVPAEFQSDLESRGYKIVEDASKAQYAVFAQDPNKELRCLPPRKKDAALANMRKAYARVTRVTMTLE